jgi:hypothetical protein
LSYASLVADSSEPPKASALSVLFHADRRLAQRLQGVIRFDPAIYREIQGDVHAIPQAIAVVIASSVLAGLGRNSLPLVFLWTAFAMLNWGVVTALIWAVGRLAVEGGVDYARLLRATGFAYAWFALLIGYSLPLVGPLFAWAGVLLSFASLVIATREVLATDSPRAFAICVLALGTPLIALFWLPG